MGGKDTKLNCVGCGSGLSMDQGEKLIVDGQLVTVMGLDEIMETVRKMKLQQRKLVADELLVQAKARNDIPEEAERRYRDAFMDEYDRRYLTIM
jgi:lipid A disaccharide synthetase